MSLRNVISTSAGRSEVAIAVDERAVHPAAAAWGEFASTSKVPERIDVLRHGDKSITFRLYGVGPSRTPVIAQRSLIAKAAIERVVYQQILPHLPLTAPCLYGYKPDGPGYAWLFLEDVGEQRYVETDPVHRNLAGRWVGLLHSAASRVPAARLLPRGGPQRFSSYLRDGRETIRANLANPSITRAEGDVLRRLIGNLNEVLNAWEQVEELAAVMPPTLAHGDFRKKNAYVRKGRDGLAIYPIDWETAGWGVPAEDLTRIDLPAYVSVVHACWWPDITLAKVERLVAIGMLFRMLAAIVWIAPQLGYADRNCLIRPMVCLREFQSKLVAAFQSMKERL